MKIARLFGLLLAISAYGADQFPKVSLVCAGRKLVYSDAVEYYTGGPAQHHILIHADNTELADIRMEIEPIAPGGPYLTLGGTKFPLGGPGIYFLSKEGDRFTVTLFLKGNLGPDELKDLPTYICQSLERYESRKKSKL